MQRRAAQLTLFYEADNIPVLSPSAILSMLVSLHKWYSGKSVPTARANLNRVVKPVGSLYAVDGDFLIVACSI